MKNQTAADKKAKIRKQTADRQRRRRARLLDEGYPRREFFLNDEENAAVIAFINEIRETPGRSAA